MVQLVVLIPLWNDAQELPRTLDALTRVAERLGPVDVVVAAGGDTGQFEAAKRLSAGFAGGSCIVIPQQPLGKMRALFDAMEVVATRPRSHLLLLDGDTRVDPDGLANAISFLDARPGLAGVGGVARGGRKGIGAAHDLVSLACHTAMEKLVSVAGWAILIRGSAVWPYWREVFAKHDYPLHIDYQICERIVARTGLFFAICPLFELQTARARGIAFFESERRHHRAMFSRGSLSTFRRYLAGALVTVSLPAVIPVAASSAFLPLLYPITLPAGLLSLRRLRDLKKQYDFARTFDPAVCNVSFAAFVCDEWVFAVSALLAATDCIRGRVDKPFFRGYRERA